MIFFKTKLKQLPKNEMKYCFTIFDNQNSFNIAIYSNFNINFDENMIKR